MTRLRKLIDVTRRALRDQRGVSAIEYSIIATGLALAVVIAWTTLGGNLSNMFTTAATNISGGTSTTAASADSGGSTSTASSDNDSDSDFDNS